MSFLEQESGSQHVWHLHIPTAVTLAHLPTEVLLDIAAHLDAASALALSWTSRRFHRDIASHKLSDDVPTAFKSNEQLQNALISLELATVETWPVYNRGVAIKDPAWTSKTSDGPSSSSSPSPSPTSSTSSPASQKPPGPRAPPPLRYACHSCLRLLPPERFALSMTVRNRAKARPPPSTLQRLPLSLHDFDTNFDVATDAGKSANSSAEAWVRAAADALPSLQRHCIACGIANGKYQKETRLQFAKEDGGKGVGFVCKRCQRFIVAVGGIDSREMSRKQCATCLKYRPPGSRYGYMTRVRGAQDEGLLKEAMA